jgi:MFS family permease
MTNETSTDLLARVKEKRARVEAFLARATPRKRRLLNITIVGGTLAAALTAAPAVGGQPFTAWLTGVFGLTSPSWRVLCGIAAACSVMSTLATQLLKSQHIEEHVTRATSCRAKLEVLEVGLATGQLDIASATSEYLRCVEDAAFLDA